MDQSLTHYRAPRIAIQLDEKSSAVSTKVQIMRVGRFKHPGQPELGAFEILPSTLLAIKKNFDANVRGVDLAIDYAHESDKDAAGWIKALSLSEDGNELWATVDWTPKGQKVLSDKEYRYLSADFSFNYQSNETSQKFGPTLFGAGLTNRPVIKEMEPVVELTELKQGEYEMSDLKDLQKKHEDLAEQVAGIAKQMDPGEGEAAKAPLSKKVVKGDEGGSADVMAKLADMEKRLAALEADEKNEGGEMGEKAPKELAEKKFEKLLSEGKVCAAQKEAFLAGDMVKFSELAADVKLANKGDGQSPQDDPASDSEDAIMKLAQEHVTSKRAKTIGQGIQIALSEKPELRKSYEGKFKA